MGEEILDVVDSNDNVVGKTSRNDIYARKLTHRIVHVFVINDAGDIYFQKRSDTVSYMPGAWCTSAGGHVLSGEDYENAARRELEEELGIKPDKLFQIGHKTTFHIADQDRFVQLYVVFSSKIPKHDKKEVSGGMFLSFGEAKKILDTENRQKIHPQLPFCFKILLENQALLTQIKNDER
ncbi:MAG TPA: NUDIX domain-containing protein [Candidatus Acidoferrum sp.]|nr:NUDIX domain-containing protein [Candidatus Acidoferrum sp.]